MEGSHVTNKQSVASEIQGRPLLQKIAQAKKLKQQTSECVLFEDKIYKCVQNRFTQSLFLYGYGLQLDLGLALG